MGNCIFCYFKLQKSLKMVQPPGFEPGTPTFVVLYSIQLNYGCTVFERERPFYIKQGLKSRAVYRHTLILQKRYGTLDARLLV